jgi:AcrR family transcriptional regulator
MVEALLEAAARVFVKEGYVRATTNRIAAAAGVSVGSLYQYFPSKDAIAVELLKRYRESLIGLVGARLAAADGATFEEIVRELFTDLFRARGINPALHRVLLEQVVRSSARKEVEGLEDRLEEVVAVALAAAKLPLADPEVAAFILVRVVLAVVHGVVIDRPRFNTPQVVDELTRLVVGYLGVPRRTAQASLD